MHFVNKKNFLPFYTQSNGAVKSVVLGITAVWYEIFLANLFTTLIDISETRDNLVADLEA